MPQTTKSDVLQLIKSKRLVAIIRLDDLSQATELSLALAKGGIVAQEFTLTNPDALKLLAPVKQALAQAGHQAVVGIGSVRNPAEADSALESGADFIVCPITNQAIIQRCHAVGVAVMPGAYTPTEIASAWDWGADVVKIFPARQLGPNYIKDVLAPMPYLQLMPTGGVDLTNISTFLKSGAVALGIGSNIVDPQAVRSGNWEAIENLARQYTQAAQSV